MVIVISTLSTHLAHTLEMHTINLHIVLSTMYMNNIQVKMVVHTKWCVTWSPALMKWTAVSALSHLSIHRMTKDLDIRCLFVVDESQTGLLHLPWHFMQLEMWHNQGDKPNILDQAQREANDHTKFLCWNFFWFDLRDRSAPNLWFRMIVHHNKCI